MAPSSADLSCRVWNSISSFPQFGHVSLIVAPFTSSFLLIVVLTKVFFLLASLEGNAFAAVLVETFKLSKLCLSYSHSQWPHLRMLLSLDLLLPKELLKSDGLSKRSPHWVQNIREPTIDIFGESIKLL